MKKFILLPILLIICSCGTKDPCDRDDGSVAPTSDWCHASDGQAGTNYLPSPPPAPHIDLCKTTDMCHNSHQY